LQNQKGAGSTNLGVRINNTTGIINLLVWDGSTHNALNAVTTINDSQWHHVAFTTTASAQVVYIDGNQDATSSHTFNNSASSDLFQIGRLGSGSSFFGGSLANVAIYSDAKTQSQIQDIMFSSYSTLTSALKTNLVSWYDLGSTSLGSELVTNGTFDSGITGWSSHNYTTAYQSDPIGGKSNVLKAPNSGAYSRVFPSSGNLVVGKAYKLTFEAYHDTSSADGLHLYLNTGADSQTTISASPTGQVWTSFEKTFTATTTNFGIGFDGSATDYFDNISVKEIQATDAQGDNEGFIYGATTNTGYTSSPSGVADPLNYGEVYGGNAVSFDGTNDFVNLGDGADLSFGDDTNDSPFTFSAWVNADDLSDFPIIAKGVYNSTAEYSWMFNGSDQLRLEIYDDSNSTYESARTDALTSFQGKWIHCVVTYDGRGGTSANQGIALYVNGSAQSLTLAGAGTYGAMKDKGADAYIGRNNTTYADGKINNVKIFNTVLTQDQVKELYTKPELTLPTGIASSALKLDMPMQEGSGTAILDGSPTFLDVAVNGDFSADAVGSTSVTGWSLDDFTAEVIADGYSGNAVQLIRVDSGTQSFYQDLSGITSGNKYKINVKLKAIGGSVSAGIRVTTPTNSNPSSNIVSLPADDSWQDVELLFTAQGTTARIQIQRQESDPGSIVVDDVIINQLNLGQNHGTGNGITWATGQEYGFQHPLVRSNNPMVFDGSNDYVDTGSSFQSTFRNSFSISLWAKPDDGQPSAESSFFGTRNSTSQDWIQSNLHTDGKVSFFYRSDNDTAEAKTSSAVFANGATSWTHIVYVADDSDDQLKIYINGSIVSVTNGGLSGITMADWTSSDELFIAARDNNGNAEKFFNGMINDVAIWDSVLTASEVTALYNSGLPLLPTLDSGNYASSSDLAGYWRNDGVTTWLDKANTGVASFDGTDDYLINNTDATWVGNTYTFSYWIKTSTASSTILELKHNSSGAMINNTFFTSLTSTGKIRSYQANSSGAVVYDHTSTNAVHNGAWHHVALSYDNSTFKIYIDGSLDSTDSGSGTISQVARRLYIGINRNDGDSTFNSAFNGQIASTNIFNTALSATEVSELYAIDKRSSISGFSQFSTCVGSWLMGAGTGDTTSTIQDQTSNNNDATVSGANLIGYNDGTVSGSPASIIVPEGLNEGRDSQGYYLTDTDSISSGIRFKGAEYINVQDSEVLLIQSNVSLEAWIKPEAVSISDSPIIMVDGYGLGLTYHNNSKLFFYIGTGGNGLAHTQTLSDGWYHVVGTWDGTTGTNGMKLYIDGSLVGQRTSTQSSTGVSDTIRIARNSSTYYKGSIDEVKIYNKALSSTEVLKNYNNGKSAHSN
jgi:hypothetical protein